jgi:hypothetical protein
MSVNGNVKGVHLSTISVLKPSIQAAPTNENRKVTRKPYKELRSREYLTPDEVESLMKAASGVGRHAHRDKTMILTGNS